MLHLAGPSAAPTRLGIVASCFVVTGLVAWVAARARTREGWDRAFALAVAAVLLVSPITWCHSFLLLLLPAALLWTAVPAGLWQRLALLGCLALMFFPHQQMSPLRVGVLAFFGLTARQAVGAVLRRQESGGRNQESGAAVSVA
jgi:hypothetical protein